MAKNQKQSVEAVEHTIDELKGPFRELVELWPSSLVSRRDIKKFSGGARSGKTYANMASIGVGPKVYKIGRTSAYRTVDLAYDLQMESNAVGR